MIIAHKPYTTVVMRIKGVVVVIFVRCLEQRLAYSLVLTAGLLNKLSVLMTSLQQRAVECFEEEVAFSSSHKTMACASRGAGGGGPMR